jgi:hypothetical protein
MPRHTTAVCVVLSAVFLLSIVVPAGAQDSRQKSIVAFSAPVQLGDTLLAAGSYQFMHAAGGRSVVVFDTEGRVLASLNVFPITRAARGATMTLRPAKNGNAPEVEAWYSSGGKDGVEFPSPRSKAHADTAAASSAPVKANQAAR